MTCPTCGTTNRPDAAFCRHCGHLLLAACPRCRAAATPDANFCDTCGYPLSPWAWTGISPIASPSISQFPNLPISPTPVGPTPLPPSDSRRAYASPAPPQAAQLAPQPPPLDRFIPPELLAKLTSARGSAAERRVVTMLFCDLKGSTAFAERLDPEEWTEIVNGAFERMVRPVYKYEGTVARLMGDGLLAFFGAPIAHEDDPRRAILAGLDIVAGIRAYRETLPPAAGELDVRVGINTGLVVVGAVGSDLRLEYSAIGDAINLAARMEQTADPGTIQIAEDTYRLVAGQFEVESLGGIEVKGKAQPVNAYRVLRRTADALRRSLAPRAALVNRRAEWETLRGAFDALAEGRGGIVFLTGDAGLGKTRLIDEAADRLLPMLDPPGRLYNASAASYETNQPYGLLIRLLRQPLGVMAGDPPERIRERLAAAVEAAEDRAVMEILFGVATSANGHEVAGEAFAAQLDACLERNWRAVATGGPLVLALDDLQWLDASSADRLARLFHLTESAPVLFICALRRDRRAPGWALMEAAGRDLPFRLAQADLWPLDDNESRALLAGLVELAGGDGGADGADLPDPLRKLVLDKAEGNPLFIEEVVQHLIEQGHLAGSSNGKQPAAVAGITLPDSLQALLTARIDRLDEEPRRVLQVASIIGRSFARATLAALVDDLDMLDRRLLDLQRAELIREVARLPEQEYAFHHTLTHEATYGTILLRQRRALHRRVAETIEARNAANPAAALTAADASDLARHFMEANEPQRALPYLQTAADNALRLHATAEAIAFYDRALPVALADESLSPRLIPLFISRGRAFELQSRFAEAKESYEEMERLAVERGDPALELEAVIAQGKLYANVTPFFDAARGRALMERAMTLAEAAGNRVAEVRILWNLVNIDRFDLNSLDNAITNGERGIAMAREMGLEEELAYLLNDIGDIYGTAGRIEDARSTITEARTHWRALGNEPMLADSLTNSAIWESIYGNVHEAIAFADEANGIATRLGNIWGEAYSRAVRGQVLALVGEFGRAVTDLTTGIQQARAANFLGGQVIAGSFLSQVYYDLDNLPAALHSANEGLAIGRTHLPQFAGMCLGRVAVAYIGMGEIDKAAEALADPLANNEKQQIFVVFDIALARIELALAQGRLDDAFRLAEDSAARMTYILSGSWVPYVRHGSARALIALGRLDEAAETLADVVAEARARGLRGGLWRFLGTWAVLEEARGNLDAAAALRAEAAAEIDFVAANTWPDELRASFLGQPDVMRVLDRAK